jgi:hypothetical protein
MAMNFFLKSNAQDIFLAFMAILVLAVVLAVASDNAMVSGVVFAGVFILMSLWFGTIAQAADERLSNDLRLKPKWLKHVLVVSNVAAVALFVGIIPNIPDAHNPNSEFPVMLPLPIGLLSIGGLVYLAMLAAKQLVTFETKRAVTFSEYQSTLLLFWFWYAGIWSLQPRVQRLLR